VEGVRALPPEKMFRQHVFKRHRSIIKVFARNIGKIEGKVIGGVDDHYIFERSERKVKLKVT